ncbi:MAG: hypothetical protein KME13_24590 [Myxacorys californica WJT36-NPBG1]|jgi:hypothetical protein|nr:hypothetical protein [Myxacorys californica WJT36-NPBG1]
MINLSIRNYQISIAGLDCTPALISFRGSDSKLDQSGLVTFTGEIVLGRPIGFESLDDRRNSRWSRGQAIIVQIADTSGTLRPSPRGGRLFILDSGFDLKTRKLTLQVGDVFALMNFKEGKGDKSGICLGTSTARGDIINRLLAASGCPNLIDSIPGSLNHPSPRLLEGNYLQQAGAIAAAAGCFLWVDSNGLVRASSINAQPSAPILSLDAGSDSADYSRLEGDQPSEEVLIRGKVTIVRKTGDKTETKTEEYGPALLAGSSSDAEIIVKRTRTLDEFERSSKLRTVQTWTEEPAGVVLPLETGRSFVEFGRTALIDSEYRIETFQYETNSPVTGKAGESKCSQGNQGRLLTHITKVYKLFDAAFEKVLETYPKDKVVDIFFLLLGTMVLVEEVHVIYRYELAYIFRSGSIDDDDPQDIPELEKLGNGPQITTRTYRAIGTVIPEDFGFKALPANVTQYRSMRSMHESERQVQTWRERTFGEWENETDIKKVIPILYPDLVAKLREKLIKQSLAYDSANLMLLTSANNTIVVSNSGQAQPPAPDTYSPPFTTQDITVSGKGKFPSDATLPFRPRQKELSFEYLSAVVESGGVSGGIANAKTEASRLASIWGNIYWGRYKGAAITTDLDDGWFNYQPLSRGDVIEPDGTAAYLMDGFAIAMAERRCVVSFDGMLLGFVDADHPAIITPIYRQTDDGELALGFSFMSRDRTYDLTPIENVGEFALGFALRPQSDVRAGLALGFSFVGFSNPEQGVLAMGLSSDGVGSIDWEEMSTTQWEEMTQAQWGNLL